MVQVQKAAKRWKGLIKNAPAASTATGTHGAGSLLAAIEAPTGKGVKPRPPPESNRSIDRYNRGKAIRSSVSSTTADMGSAQHLTDYIRGTESMLADELSALDRRVNERVASFEKIVLLELKNRRADAPQPTTFPAAVATPGPGSGVEGGWPGPGPQLGLEPAMGTGGGGSTAVVSV